MSWQQESIKKYEDKLAREWTVEGKRQSDPKNMCIMVTPSGKQVSEPFDVTKTVHIPLNIGSNDRIGDLRMKSTREICGND